MRPDEHRTLASIVPLLVLALALGVAPPVSASLLGWWTADACTGADASGHAAALTPFNSPACPAGRFGNAFTLDGSTQYLERGSDPSFMPGARAWTVAAWVKSTATSDLQMVVDWYRCGANPVCTTADGAYYILSLDHGHPSWDIRDDAAMDVAVEDTTLQLADGAWHFLAGAMNPATDSVKLYVDGALRKTAGGAITALTSGPIAIPLEVGRHFRTGWDVPGYYLNGSIDEVRIYDEELPPSAIAHLYTGNAVTAVEAGPHPAFTIDDVRPNPSRGGALTVSFTLPSDAPTQVGLFDVAGRRIVRVTLEHPSAGPRSVELGAGRTLPPGLYMVRVTQGELAAMQRVTVIR